MDKKQNFLLGVLAALAATPLVQSLREASDMPPIPMGRMTSTRKTNPKSYARNPLRGYYARYSHVLTEANLYAGKKHPFSEKKG